MDAKTVALAKTVKDKALKAARDGLTVGSHPIDCMVRITGSIKVGADSEADVRGSVNYRDAFATVCGMLVRQCQRNNDSMSDETLKDLIGIAMRQDKMASAMGDAMEEWIEPIERDCTKVTGTQKRSGSVTTKLNYEFVETPQEELADAQLVA